MLGVRPVHRGRHDVVCPAGDEEERCAAVVLVVDPGLLMTGLEVGDQAVRPDPVPRRGDVVPLVDLRGLLLGQRVREGVVELVRREPDGLVPVRRVLEDREQRLDLRRWVDAHALGRGRVDHDAGGAAPAVEQELGERAAEGMAHDDRRPVELRDDTGEVRNGLGHRQRRDHRRVLAERLHLDLEPWVAGRDDPVALALVVRDPLLPAARGHPQPVDQDDGVGARRVAAHGDLLRG